MATNRLGYGWLPLSDAAGILAHALAQTSGLGNTSSTGRPHICDVRIYGSMAATASDSDVAGILVQMMVCVALAEGRIFLRKVCKIGDFFVILHIDYSKTK